MDQGDKTIIGMKKNHSFRADINTVDTINYAYSLVKMCGEVGITKDGSIVTTKMCCDYRKKKKDLVLWMYITIDNTIEIKYFGDV